MAPDDLASSFAFSGLDPGPAAPAALPDWPLFGLGDDVREALAAARAGGEPVALATLASTVGGAPRPPGAQMLIGPSQLSGFLSGGCVEGDIALHAAGVISSGAPRRLVYGEGSPYPDIRLLCGARIEVLVERVGPDDPAAGALLRASTERRPVHWFTDGRRRRCEAVDGRPPPGDWVLARRYDPRARLVVVGGDPTALAIAALALQMGYETHLARPRGPPTPPPLPGLTYHRGPPETALAAVPLDSWTSVAVATHDLEVDEAALVAALASDARYVGVLGARRRIPERRARLLARGVSPAALARLHAPIGLDLGGKSPFEIAVAVMGEITAAVHAEAPARLLDLQPEHL